MSGLASSLRFEWRVRLAEQEQSLPGVEVDQVFTAVRGEGLDPLG